ncbi:MAG: DUF1641 domain-containing protein [Candidatus Thermoplasmatota archaeon]|nr:DUF1641 domain-containing protein [Candidatus Thermoplasmatota archaeon]MCL5665858.1 DUF1641 domain-containing protein [Candidatus Thermoplasmatota archaeon]
MVEKVDEQEPDEIEELLKFVTENRRLVTQTLNMLKRVESSGLLDELQDFLMEFIPSDHSVVTSFLESQEGRYALSKIINLLPGVAYLLSSERTSDLIKSLLFNADSFSDALIEGANNPQTFGLMKLMSLMKDPEFTSGFTALLNFIGMLGKVIKKTNV